MSSSVPYLIYLIEFLIIDLKKKSSPCFLAHMKKISFTAKIQ